MRRHLTITTVALLFSFFVGIAGATAAPNDADRRVYALIVANNSSVDADVEALRYADDDGARYYELFSSIADDATLLTTLDAESQRVFPELASRTLPPTRAQLTESVKGLASRIDADRKAGRQVELYLVFSGHGNVDDTGEGYLSLADGKLRRSELYRDVIRPLEAHYTHLIIDACHAYFMVRSRGGRSWDDTWQDDRSGQSLDNELRAHLSGPSRRDGQTTDGHNMRTVGVILSTSGAAEVHEWSKYRAGVFSHQLRSGLLGAADVDGDGRVTYRELEAYLAAANARVQNPRARIHVHVEPPAQDRGRALVALDDYQDAVALEIPAGSGGRFHVEDARGVRYADLHVDPTSAVRLTLLRTPVAARPFYYLRAENEQARLTLDVSPIRSTELAFETRTEQARGSVEEAFRTSLFAVPFGPGFYAGFIAAREQAEAYDEPGRSPSNNYDAPFRLRPGFAYGLGTPVLDVDGLQHIAAASLFFEHRSGFGVGPYLSYGFTSTDAPAHLHRLAIGVEGAYRFALAPSIDLSPRLRLAHQGVLIRASELRADPIGLRTEAALTLGIKSFSQATLELEPGISGDLVTRSGVESNVERFYLNPFLNVGLRF